MFYDVGKFYFFETCCTFKCKIYFNLSKVRVYKNKETEAFFFLQKYFVYVEWKLHPLNIEYT